ncbi:MAG: SprB repeat-containing protein [Bacteroidetes bacterium]|nr:SprB repeat-containing protein [Bacteroidota bacterium]
MKKLLSLITLLFIGSIAFSQISLTENHTAPTCYGYSDGTATITATGGTAPYSFTLSATQNTTGTFTGLASGTQTVVVEDAASFTATIALTIPVPPQIIPTVTSIPALCFGAATGTINVTNVSGGNAPYQYELNASSYQTSSTFLNVLAGLYSVGVKDASGCIGSQTVQVTQPTQVNSNVSSTPACNGVCSATANVNSFGGTAPYQYSWSDGSTTSQVPNLCAGTYTVQTLDANNCVVQNSISVISYSINLTVTSTSVLCNGTPTGTINITSVIGGNPVYQYNLNGGAFTSSPVFTNAFA